MIFPAPIAVVSLSGGKDSLATCLVAIEQYGRERVIAAWADTGHEHPLTVKYVTEYLPGALGLEVHVVRADFTRQIAGKRKFIMRNWEYMGVPLGQIDRALELLQPTGNAYLDLCIWKGRFPSRKAQFCTEFLKRNPLDGFTMNLCMQGYHVESWQGVRRDESESRKDACAFDWSCHAIAAWPIRRPIAGWTAERVLRYATAHGIEHNPLYRLGMKRVGCMPCINCGKDELLEISKRWPEEISRVAEWENLVAGASKWGDATFFADTDGDGPARSAGEYSRIRKVVEWSKTSRGGKQYDFLRALPSEGCSSVYGLCE